jgi:hypothetical protein
MSLELTPHDTAVRNDRSAQLALLLARELWVLKDRVMVLEDVLSRQGTPLTELIERHQPTDALKARIEAERKRFAAEVVAALEAPGDRRG